MIKKILTKLDGKRRTRKGELMKSIKCWNCHMELIYIDKIGYIHPIKDKDSKCDVMDGIEIIEVSPEIRKYFVNKCNQSSSHLWLKALFYRIWHRK